MNAIPWQPPPETLIGSPFSLEEFEEGLGQRLSVLLLLDTSTSMDGPRGTPPGKRPIDELNVALEEWSAELRSTEQRHLHDQVEIALILFGSEGVTVTEWVRDNPFRPAAVFDPPKLTAGGVTPLFEAIDVAIKVSEKRKEQLDEQGIERFRPMMFLLSDGLPTDEAGYELTPATWDAPAIRLRELEDNDKLVFFAAGVGDAVPPLLETLAPVNHWLIKHGSFLTFLRFVSASLGAGAARDPISVLRDFIKQQATES